MENFKDYGTRISRTVHSRTKNFPYFPVPSIPEQKISRTFPYRHSRTIFSRGNTSHQHDQQHWNRLSKPSDGEEAIDDCHSWFSSKGWS